MGDAIARATGGMPPVVSNLRCVNTLKGDSLLLYTLRSVALPDGWNMFILKDGKWVADRFTSRLHAFKTETARKATLDELKLLLRAAPQAAPTHWHWCILEGAKSCFEAPVDSSGVVSSLDPASDCDVFSELNELVTIAVIPDDAAILSPVADANAAASLVFQVPEELPDGDDEDYLLRLFRPAAYPGGHAREEGPSARASGKRGADAARRAAPQTDTIAAALQQSGSSKKKARTRVRCEQSNTVDDADDGKLESFLNDPDLDDAQWDTLAEAEGFPSIDMFRAKQAALPTYINKDKSKGAWEIKFRYTHIDGKPLARRVLARSFKGGHSGIRACVLARLLFTRDYEENSNSGWTREQADTVAGEIAQRVEGWFL